MRVNANLDLSVFANLELTHPMLAVSIANLELTHLLSIAQRKCPLFSAQRFRHLPGL